MYSLVEMGSIYGKDASRLACRTQVETASELRGSHKGVSASRRTELSRASSARSGRLEASRLRKIDVRASVCGGHSRLLRKHDS